jgi:hypothetical protein
MKRSLLVVILVLAVLLAVLIPQAGTASQTRAEQRAKDFAYAINYRYKEPEAIYAFLDASFKEEMSADAFAQAFAKERSYPYLTPFFINFRFCDMSEDMLHGTAHYSQAARLPGMTRDIEMVFEQGDYYFHYFEDLADGSYLEKFADIPYSLDMYFDFPATDGNED